MAGSRSKQLVLVDGSSYLYRAFHAMPNLSNSAGEPTGAVYGIVNMLRRLLAELSPAHIAVVFDAKGKTFRDELYAEYKANRPPMPEQLQGQVALVHAVVEAMGIPLLVIPGVEADDVIGTLAVKATEKGFDTLVSTGDKDMAQLVDEHVTLVDTMQNAVYDRAGVEQKFGVPPERIVDLLALIGDTSDNIPGVPKVGPKTASKWLVQYGSLDEIVAHADELGGKVGENLRSCLDQLDLSRTLATIKLDVDVGLEPEALVRRPADESQLKSLYAKLEFRTWLAELGGLDAAAEPGTGSARYTTIVDAAELERWVARLEQAPVFALDTETTSLDAMRAELVGVSFSVTPGEAAYVPVAHDYEGAPPQLSREQVLTALKALLENPARPKLGQNLKYDRTVLANHGIDLQGIRFDTMLESYVLDSTAVRHDMDSLAIKYLGYKTIKYEEVAGKGKSQLAFNRVPLERAAPYAAEDADITLRLHQTLWPRLEAEPALRTLFQDLEMPLVPVLSRIERHGVRVDADMLRKQGEELAKRILDVEALAHREAGVAFNIASPKQIQEILFDRLQLPVTRKTPKGQPSTAENVLQELAVEYELPRLILEHRALAKLKSTYTDKLPELVNPRTGRIHTSYHQAVAATGRLASSDPNLQNIPVRTPEGRRIREAFVPEPGYRLLSADYSQIELRIMAHLSADAGLMRAFAEGADIHRATAAEVFGVALDAVSDEQRRPAKAINFGLIYGMSAFGLARQLHIDRGSAQDYVDLYFRRYPGVKAFMDATRESARERGFVETVFGRRLYVGDINASNFSRRQYAERTAINAPMQGTAADLIKMAMLEVDRWITHSGANARVILQVHDELVLEVAKDAVEQVRQKLVELMSGVGGLSVDLVVDTGVGENWAQAHS